LTNAVFSLEWNWHGLDVLATFQPILIGSLGDGRSGDESLGLSLVEDNFMWCLWNDRGGDQVLGANVANADFHWDGHLGGLLNVSTIGDLVGWVDGESESVGRVED